MASNGKTVALVVAAGSGSRAGGAMPKQYAPLAGRPLLAHALDHLTHPGVDEVYVVIGKGQEVLLAEAVGDRAVTAVTGGSVRRQSVLNGLEAIAADQSAANVLIHDAARPFLPAEVIDRLLARLEEAEAVVPVLPVVDSLAFVSNILEAPMPRDGLARVQTPQAFRFDAILGAHRAWRSDAEATDDAQVARAAGMEVQTVEGSAALDKLTYAEDFAAAEQRLSAQMVSRTAMGFDVHALAAGEELWLAGVRIPHDRGLKGHSDADVALHALTDALLGTIGAGDIGQHFPPSDPQWRGAPSSRFLEHARDLILARGGRIDHVDLTIICEAPKIGPHREAMRETIAGLLRLPLGRISLKATTTERLGFTGRGEGIAAQAAATVRLLEES